MKRSKRCCNENRNHLMLLFYRQNLQKKIADSIFKNPLVAKCGVCRALPSTTRHRKANVTVRPHFLDLMSLVRLLLERRDGRSTTGCGGKNLTLTGGRQVDSGTPLQFSVHGIRLRLPGLQLCMQSKHVSTVSSMACHRKSQMLTPGFFWVGSCSPKAP